MKWFNRTFMELKPCIPQREYRLRWFNRTFMELKQTRVNGLKERIDRFNRTFMELKLLQHGILPHIAWV